MLTTSLALAFSLLQPAAGPAPKPLHTIAEDSGFVRTGRYDEVIALCAAFQQAYRARARCFDFGTTPEGRPMKALAISDDGVLDAASATRKQRPVVLAQGGIHAGEIDGKDAGFLVVRELLEGKLVPGALKKLTFVFVPVFNIDGHERMSPNNRPNQRGPEVMGFRTTAQNFNLNRDYVKADAPEMRAMLGLMTSWDPVLFLDLHVTDGAQFQHDVAVMVDPTHDGAPALKDAAIAFSHDVNSALNAQGHHALEFYPSFVVDDDPASGFAAGVAPPRFSQRYWSLHNRIGVLVETHSWKDYQTRVQATHDVLQAALTETAAHGAAWRTIEHDADVAARNNHGGDVVITFKNDAHTTTLDFLGYAYTKLPSALSGGTVTTYDEQKPEVWHVPFKDVVVPDVVVTSPKGGYVVPAAYAQMVSERLRAHGIHFTTLTHEQALHAQTFRAVTTTFGPKPYESHQSLKVTGAWKNEDRTVPRGSLYVPADQPLRALVVELFEPLARDSLLQWGFFNQAFEQKEYMEAYVAEVEAERMIKDPAVKAAFDAKLASDPAFAKDPDARLGFFYRRHASHDERQDLYPVVRVEQAPE
jgi:hypothetical protein